MKKLLITDLDNTLYDWVSFFAQSFGAMLEKTVEITGIDRDELVDDFKQVHQYHSNTEYPFSIFELDSIQEKYKTKDKEVLKLHLDEALHSFNSKRKKVLKCYSGVIDTLEYMSQKGVKIVAHTEAPVRNSLYRLEKLGIKGYFSHLYAPKDKFHDDLDEHTLQWLQKHENSLRLLSKNELKPNPNLLLDICSKEGVQPSEAVYIGDSIVKDISMANEAGISSVWAEYGKQHSPEFWQLLVSITHWTPADVEREESLKKALSDSKPNYIAQSFSDLIELFDWQGVQAKSSVDLQ
ncbi:HAD family hydrolase [Pseudoalteromonas sp. T1lg88]|uniref:HAD family hydrolase n=1 Tax=Pseudoalteromonas sp. T1lg88 TaxID=2077104 RepID=UPI000CF70CCB|nr:HAD-IA family hydrolase [Pseudoalteromonas sp. T1lg88]